MSRWLFAGVVLVALVVFTPLWALALASSLGHPFVPETGSPVAVAVGFPVFAAYMVLLLREVWRD